MINCLVLTGSRNSLAVVVTNTSYIKLDEAKSQNILVPPSRQTPLNHEGMVYALYDSSAAAYYHISQAASVRTLFVVCAGSL